jgi:hypothetical protein
VGDVMTGSQLSLSAAFGYSPTGNSRLYGISNYSFGMVAAASCLLAAFIADRWRSGRGRVAAIGLLAAVLVVIGMPVFGSDVGGIIAFTPTILVFAALVSGYRLRLRTVVLGLVATAAAVVAFGLLDLARPPGQRAHLGRLFERIGNEGLGPLLSIIERKLLANLAVTTSSFWVAVIPIAVAFIVFLARYPTRPLTRLYELVPTLRAGVLSAIVAAVLGSAVNDSGLTVGGVTMFVTVAALAWLALDTVAPLPATAAGRRGRADGREQGGGHVEADEPDGAGGPSGDDRPIAAADGSPSPAGTPGATPAGAPSPSSPSAVPPARAGADPA